MKPLFEVKEVDRQFYAERLRDFLPARMIDSHTHVWLDKFVARQTEEPVRAVTWPARVARDNPVEDLQESYRLLLPDKQVTPLIFGFLLSKKDDEHGGNGYVSEVAMRQRLPALIFALPDWNADQLEEKILRGGFLGAKVYLTLSASYLPEKEIRIFDYLPHHQLEVLNRHGWIAILHIPRDGRLRDPVNLAQLLEIEDRYPRLKLIVAHVGRAYCPEDIGAAFGMLAGTRRMLFDFAANTNSEVFRRLIETVGARRILFGSDLPIVRMRMRRVCEGGNYVNIVPRGLYGDVSGDKHMREVDGADAERLTFFLYEQLDAFRRAAESSRLTRAEIEDVFFGNADRVIRAAREG